MTAHVTYLLLPFFFGFFTQAPAGEEKAGPPLFNCNANVDAGPDQTICDPATVTLTGSVNPPGFLSVSWMPTTGLGNPNSLTTTAAVNQTITYTLTATVASNQNLITNGDFSAGLTGFTSDYIPGTGGAFGLLSSEGQFTVASNASQTHTNFAPCTDHTGGGNMLVVNGAGVPNQDVWCQQVTVTPGATYAFSVWITSVISSSPAQLQFSVNGQLLGGIFTASSATCTWNNFYQTWSAGGGSTAEICIVNQNTSLSGNDFAIDDLFFGEVCDFSDDVTITLQQVDAGWTPPTGLCPFSPIVDLNGLLNPGATPGGSWTVDGVSTQFFDPLLLGPGAHEVSYTVGTPPCVETNTQFIIIETLPLAEWDIPFSPCESSPPISLNIFLNQGSDPSGTWTVNGVPATELDPALLGAGPHFLVYTVGTPPCINQHSGFIDILPAPDVSWIPPAPLCAGDPAVDPSTWLTPNADPGGSWTVDGQTILAFDPQLLAPGDYTVTYSAGAPPCDDALTQTVTILALPDPAWSAAGFYCETEPAFALNDLLDPGATPGGDWTIDGQAAATLDPGALAAGTYVLTYSVSNGGCSADLADSITVGPVPFADFSLSADSLCLSDTLTVTYTGTLTDNLTLNWSVDSLPAPADTILQLDAFWDAPGVYTISLWVAAGPCVSDTVSHQVVIAAPLAAPEPSCGPATNQSVSISWPAVTGADSYLVEILPGDTVLTTDTTLLIGGLLPGEEAGFVVWAVSDSPCPPVPADTLYCSAQDCDPVPLAIQPVAPLCDSDTLASFQLAVQLTDTTGLGKGFWSGPGIVDSLNGIFDPALAGTGIHPIIFQYELFNCLSIDSTTIEIIAPPAAAFDLPAESCAGDTVTLAFTGQSSPGDVLHWDADGGQVIAETDSALLVIYPVGVTYQPSLWVEGPVCVSDTFSVDLSIAAPLTPPQINCRTTSTSVEFYWAADPAAESYTVLPGGGLTGVLTSDTSYLFSGLTPGQEVGIELLVQPAGPCPAVSVMQSCIASDCPDYALSIEPFGPLCLSDTLTPFNLSANLQGGDGTGTFSWSGTGVTDTLAGLFDPLSAGPGEHLLQVTYRENVCTYQAQLLISLFPQPVAAFVIDTLFCQRDTVSLSFTGAAPAGSNFDWDFGQAEVVSGGGPGPFILHWSTPGVDAIRLQLSANSCVSDLFIQNIQIDAPPAAPPVDCQASYTEATFTWPAGSPDATVTVLNGPAGQLSADSSYQVAGLMPGQSVQLQIDWLSGNNCPDTSVVVSCATLPCPEVALTILPVDTVCWDGVPDTLQLLAELSGNGPDGVLSWQGPGMVDSLAGLWSPQAGMAGQDVSVTATYREAVCVFQADLEIPVRPQPASDFSIDSLRCVEATAQALWEGIVADNIIFTWDFGAAQADPGTGPGPHELSWPAPGNYEVKLQVAGEGCVSETSIRTVQVDAPLSETTPACTVDFTAMTLSWPAVDGAQDYALTAPQPFPAGTWLADTVYQIEGLAPGTAFDFELTINGATVCGPVSQLFSCATLDCPDLNAALAAPADICAGQEATVSFTADPAGAPYRLVLGAGGEELVFENMAGSATLSLFPANSQHYDILSIESLTLPDCGVTGPLPFSIVVQDPPEAGLPLESPAFCNNLDTTLNLVGLVDNAGTGGTWSDVSGVAAGSAFDAQAGTFRPWQLAAGTYDFRYLVTGSPVCPADSLTVSVTVHPTPVADAGADQTLDCLVSLVSIGGPSTSDSPGLQYEWTAEDGGSVTEPTLPYTDVSRPGRYLLTVTDPVTGCSDEDAVLVDSDVAFPTAAVRLREVSCAGDNDGVILIDSISGGTAPYSFALNDGPFGGQATFTGLGPGEYRLRVRDSRDCETELFFTLVDPTVLDVQLSSNLDPNRLVITLGDSLYLEAQVNVDPATLDTLYWQPDTLPCPGCLAQRLAPVQETLFTVTVVDENGCTATDQLRVFVRKDNRVYIPNAFSPNGDGINDVVMVFGGPEVRQVLSFEIFNRWGESVFLTEGFPPNDPVNGWDGMFRSQPMNPGVFVYYARVEMVDGTVAEFKGDMVLMR